MSENKRKSERQKEKRSKQGENNKKNVMRHNRIEYKISDGKTAQLDKKRERASDKEYEQATQASSHMPVYMGLVRTDFCKFSYYCFIILVLFYSFFIYLVVTERVLATPTLLHASRPHRSCSYWLAQHNSSFLRIECVFLSFFSFYAIVFVVRNEFNLIDYRCFVLNVNDIVGRERIFRSLRAL